jgi:hypothetical protein
VALFAAERVSTGRTNDASLELAVEPVEARRTIRSIVEQHRVRAG